MFPSIQIIIKLQKNILVVDLGWSHFSIIHATAVWLHQRQPTRLDLRSPNRLKSAYWGRLPRHTTVNLMVFLLVFHPLLAPLQRVLHAAARLVDELRPKTMTEALKNHHWLPVKQRIEYKLYSCTKQVSGLSARLQNTCRTCSLPVPLFRQLPDYVNLLLLRLHRLKSMHSGNLVFLVSGPLLWNALPNDINVKA